jgi:hypothetical protein
VHNPRKGSHPGTAEREERPNIAPHFLYHYDKNTKTALCAAIGRSREPEKKHISVVRPV